MGARAKIPTRCRAFQATPWTSTAQRPRRARQSLRPCPMGRPAKRPWSTTLVARRRPRSHHPQRTRRMLATSRDQLLGERYTVDPEALITAGRCVYQGFAVVQGECSEDGFSSTCPAGTTCLANQCRDLCLCDADCGTGLCCNEPASKRPGNALGVCAACRWSAQTYIRALASRTAEAIRVSAIHIRTSNEGGETAGMAAADFLARLRPCGSQ
jgi:hypothetical protein